MKKLLLISILLLCTHSNFSQDLSQNLVLTLKNPRADGSSWLLDQSKILETAGSQDRVNQILSKLENDTRNERKGQWRINSACPRPT